MNGYSICFCSLYYQFTTWSWQELIFGLKEGIIEIDDVVFYVNETISTDKSDYDTIMQILIVDKDEVEAIVMKLALNEKKQNEDIIVSKWIFLIIYYYDVGVKSRNLKTDY